MNLTGALAALLLAGPSHGYELLTSLESELGPVWRVRTSHLYLTLGRMARDGLVVTRRVPQERRPDRQLVALSDVGSDVANRWLWESNQADELSIRLMVGRLVLGERFAELVDRASEQTSAELHRLRATRAGLGEAGFGPETTELEIRRLQADLRWLERLRRRADALVARPRAAHSAPSASLTRTA